MDNTWTEQDEEKLRNLVRGRLMGESRSRRDVILSGAHAFTQWFMTACFDIWDTIKKWVSNVWEWLFG